MNSPKEGAAGGRGRLLTKEELGAWLSGGPAVWRAFHPSLGFRQLRKIIHRRKDRQGLNVTQKPETGATKCGFVSVYTRAQHFFMAFVLCTFSQKQVQVRITPYPEIESELWRLAEQPFPESSAPESEIAGASGEKRDKQQLSGLPAAAAETPAVSEAPPPSEVSRACKGVLASQTAILASHPP